MSNNKSDHLMRHDRQSRRVKRRLKSSVVRDPNGSVSTFRQFYQSGGRDYEQYRRWLETLSKSEQVSTPSVDSIKIKKEPLDIGSNVNTILPSSGPSVHSQQPLQRIAGSHPLVKPVRHLPTPIESAHSLPLSLLSPLRLTTTSLKPPIPLPWDHSHLSTLPVSFSFCSPPLMNWSVADVGRFIEKHFPERNIAQKFIQQKIDGRTLPLLTEDHLTRIFKMKLGPALHLLALIATIPK